MKCYKSTTTCKDNNIGASTVQVLSEERRHMPSKLPQFNIRVEQSVIDKITYIAGKNERSANKEIVYLIKQRIEKYESEHGEINLNEV